MALGQRAFDSVDASEWPADARASWGHLAGWLKLTYLSNCVMQNQTRVLAPTPDGTKEHLIC